MKNWCVGTVARADIRGVACHLAALLSVLGWFGVGLAPEPVAAALLFNGSNQYVTFGSATNLDSGTFSLELWFKWSGGGATATTGSGGVTAVPLIAKGVGEAEASNRDGNYFLGINPTTAVLVADLEEGAAGALPGQNHPVTGALTISLNVWHHAAVTYDGTTWRLYLDGMPDTTLVVGQPPRSDSIQYGGLAAAQNSTGTRSGGFPGLQAEARIWNYARTALQITNNLRLAIPTATGLLGRWPLTETTGSVANDTSGNAVNGTLMNAPVWTNDFPFVTTPTVALSAPTNGATLLSPGTTTLSATAFSPNGTVQKVEFYDATTKLGQTTNTPFAYAWTNPPLGVHSLTAVATDSTSLAVTSAVVSVTVVSNQPPVVALTSPANNDSFVAPGAVALTAAASDTDDAITTVEFYANGSKLAQVSATPYTNTWLLAPAGSYALTAVAVDTGGLRSTSAPITITIVQPVGSQWVAFNDQQIGPGSALNDTYYTLSGFGVTAGPLSNIVSGATLSASLTITNNPGPDAAGTMSAPLPGTPAYRFFNGYIDWNGGTGTANGIHLYPTNVVGYTFSGLDSARQYRLTVTSVRGGAPDGGGANNYYSNRWMQVELLDALASTPTHSAGVITSSGFPSDLSGNQAAFNTGVNTNGDIVQYDGIVPGPGGAFTLMTRQYLGAFPGGYGTNGLYCFGLSALRLEEMIGNTVVSLTSPATNGLFALPTNLVVAATVAGPRSITNVAFYANTQKLGQTNLAPYAITWNAAVAGTYQLTAVAADSLGVAATSAPVSIRVVLNDAPLVSITSPADTSAYPTPANLTIQASASDTYGISKVEFYEGGVKFGESATQPYQASWSGASLGLHLLTAVASDIFGRMSTSAVVHVTVTSNLPPTVALTSPAAGSSFVGPGAVPITAVATSDDPLAALELYAGGTQLTQLTTNPASYLWVNVPGGSYALRAVAVDSAGQRATSAPVNITVSWPFGAQWVAFNDQQQGPASAPNATFYTLPTLGTAAGSLSDVASGSSLAASLTVSTSTGPDAADPMAAPLPGTPAYNLFNGYIDWNGGAGAANGYNLYRTNLVRYSFAGLDTTRQYRLTVTAVRGGAPAAGGPDNYYSNRWTSVQLLGAPSYTPTHSAGVITSNNVSDLLGNMVAFNAGVNTNGEMVQWSNIVPASAGTFMVQIRQYLGAFPGGAGSNAISSFGLTAVRLEEFVTATTVRLTTPASNAVFLVPTNLVLAAQVVSPGAISNVAFYANALKLGQSLTSPYSFTWSNVPPGGYQLSAVATDTTGLATTSAPVAITVISNDPPLVSLTSPADNSSYSALATLILQATASDAYGISKIEFYDGLSKLGETGTVPYQLPWSGVAAGAHLLTAVATDTFGLSATSTVVHVTMTNGPALLVSITNPLNNASFAAPAIISINAGVTGGSGTVTNVSFYAGSLLLGKALAAPYTILWTNSFGGSYVLTAVALDNGGLQATSAPVLITVVAPLVSQWVAYNDQNSGANTAPTVTTYSMTTAGTVVGGPLLNFDTGGALTPNQVGLVVSSAGAINGAGSTSTAPNTGTPADQIFTGKVDWSASSIQFAASNYTGALIYTFTNLVPGRRYSFQGTAIRGGSYPGRWTIATLVGASSATPAHQTGSGSPGIITNGWPTYGDPLAPGTQAAWNSGNNVVGDVVGWTNIAPAGTSFSIICSNYHAVTATGPLGALENSYVYALSAVRLEEFLMGGPQVRITSPLNNALVVLPTNLVISALASGFGGTVTNVAFYRSATKLGDVTNSPYNFAWPTVGVGTYLLTAVGSDNTGLSVTSAAVRMVVQSNVAPTVAITSPTDGSSYSVGGSFEIDAAAADSRTSGTTNSAIPCKSVA